ncbi:hypothetical protein G4G27_13850 [Sphingomonas sp. So64.6b]|uniref:hypothetical protein n=1 Tax=Sphingomonas sp. So64.6b TaxID=2997354 RepID=UPI001600517E|nr:hypothetical protein [Sphingomonas sp. So64.6b]QNA84958.1 hypothetical protein G4G27_13850 [Sphingomonas sp. So64.6b]
MTFSTPRLWLRKLAGLGVTLFVVTYFLVGNRLLRNRHIRYELTIAIQTPEGVRRGSSIIQATIERSVPFWGDNGIHHTVTGNAPMVELPDGRLVFALLGGSGNVSLPELAAQDTNVIPFISDWKRRKSTNQIWSRLKAKRPHINVDAATMRRRETPSAGSRYPTIVVLDPANAKPIRRIELANCEEMLGPGFSVTGLELRFVDTPPDTAFDPPWLRTVSQALDDLRSSDLPRLDVDLANLVARRAG